MLGTFNQLLSLQISKPLAVLYAETALPAALQPGAWCLAGANRAASSPAAQNL